MGKILDLIDKISRKLQTIQGNSDNENVVKKWLPGRSIMRTNPARLANY
jgi:hypothetical protein